MCATELARDAVRPAVVEATLSSTATDWMPALSSDGTEIFFSSDRNGGAGSFDLYCADWISTAGAFGAATRVAEAPVLVPALASSFGAPIRHPISR